ncbi:MAG: response regulator, partial [Fusobacteriota bacterium]
MKGLIIEDDKITRKLVKRIVRSYGEVRLAEDGDEGIEKFKNEIEEGGRFDFVCLDLSMPGLSGYDVLKEIRNIEDLTTSKKTTIIIMSALGTPENIKEGYSHGCDYYLVKPFNKGDLISILDRLEQELS